MSDFNSEFANKILANDPQLLRDWIAEMEGKVGECTPEECAILRRRIRIVRDYLREDTETNRSI